MTDITIEQGAIITIKLPGLTAVRINTETRVIAIDGISGCNFGPHADLGPWAPEFIVKDLRGGIYGDFHQLRRRDECSDRECAESGQHSGAYAHFHEDIEEVSACRECIDRAADLRVLAGE